MWMDYSRSVCLCSFACHQHCHVWSFKGCKGRISNSIPTPGTAWLEGRLLAALGLKVGDSFDLGASSFTIDRVLISEPDRGGQLFNIAPRVLINMADIESTQLVLPGSRVRHHYVQAARETARRPSAADHSAADQRNAFYGLRPARDL